jgi:hypothetical protein
MIASANARDDLAVDVPGDVDRAADLSPRSAASRRSHMPLTIPSASTPG